MEPTHDAAIEQTSRESIAEQKIREALVFTRLAIVSKSPLMIDQHMRAVERLLEYVLRVS